jgi:hypothetical protein
LLAQYQHFHSLGCRRSAKGSAGAGLHADPGAGCLYWAGHTV